MRDDIPSQVTVESLKTFTRPLFLIEIGFSVPLRLCDRETVTIAEGTFPRANFDVISSRGFRLFDENFAFAPTFRSEGAAGQSAKVYGSYGDKTWTSSDFYLVFSGYLGSVTLGPMIDAAFRITPAKRSPRGIIGPPLCNHLPNPGTEILTPTGRYLIP